MKKFVFILTAIMLCLCFALFAACGTDNAGGANNNGGSGGNQTSGNTDNDGEGDDGDFVYYTVTFDSQGGSAVESEKVLAGNPAHAPMSPAKDNYGFIGWYDSAEGGALWNFFTDRVDRNITLYAHWEEVKQTPEPTPTLIFEKHGNEYTVTGDSGQAANIVIPATHDDLPVTAIADSAFAYSKHTADILSVTIPDSVTQIGKNAFYNQDALASVEIGEASGLQSIGNNAFSGNSALKSIYLPAGLTSLGDSVFNNCGGLEEIEVAEENTRYSGEGNCLIDLSTHTLIRGSNKSEIPASVTKIGEAAFRKATLTTLTIPVSVTSIDKYAVQNCAIERIIYEGTRAQWEQVVKSSHKNWNMGKTDLQISCSDDNA